MKAYQLAELVNGRLLEAGRTEIERIADLDQAGDGEIAYVDNEKFYAAAAASVASCLIVPEGAAAPLGTDPEVARLKSSAEMVAAIEPAVRLYEEVPTEGMDVEDKIESAKTDHRDKPKDDIKIESIELS